MSPPDGRAHGSEQWARHFRAKPSRAHSNRNAPGNQPQLASWKPPRQRERETQSISLLWKRVGHSLALAHSLRRLAFRHFADDFAGARCIIRQDIKLRASSLLIHSAVDPILVTSGNQELPGPSR